MLEVLRVVWGQVGTPPMQVVVMVWRLLLVMVMVMASVRQGPGWPTVGMCMIPLATMQPPAMMLSVLAAVLTLIVLVMMLQ